MPQATPLNTNWDARQSRIDMLREQAKALRDQQAPEGKMVDGWYVPPALTQQLNFGLSPIISALRENVAAKQQQQLEADQSRDMQRWMRERPIAGDDPDTTPMPPVGQAQNITQPTQQEQLAWAQRGMANPLTKTLAQEMTKDIAITQPKEARKRTFDYNQLTRRLEQADRHLAMRLQDKQLDRDQRAELQNQRLAVQQQLAAASNAARIQAARVGRSNINVNVGNSDVRDLEAAAAEREMMTDALDKLDDPNVGNWATTGPGAFVTGALLGGSPARQTILRALRDSDTNDAYQTLDMAQQQYLHGQFGTQLTKTELAEFAKVAPSPTDSKQEIIRKGEQFVRLRDQQMSRLRKRAQSGGVVDVEPTTPLPQQRPPQPPQFSLDALGGAIGQANDAAHDAMGNTQVPQLSGRQPKIRRWNPQTGSFE